MWRLALPKQFSSPRLILMRSIAAAKLDWLRARFGNRNPPRRILFYPHAPSPRAILYKVCHRAGYIICTDPCDAWDLAIHWDTATVRLPLDLPEGSRLILNRRCLDVSKLHLSRLFAQVFGYEIFVDPLHYAGDVVRKSDENGAHDGIILRCPLAAVEPGFVYQRLVANHVSADLVEDLRTPVFRNRIPFVYRKLRPRLDRFSNWNVDVQCCAADEVFSQSEQERILALARELGMDYGEMDILRDRTDDRLYVVDANPTPWGPPNHIRDGDRRFALDRMTQELLIAGSGDGVGS